MSYQRSASEEVLVWKLQYMIDHQFALPPGQEADRIVHEVLDCLGSPDPYLRDELGYTVLSELIDERNLLTSAQLRVVLERGLSDEMLFAGLGEWDEDRVFLRSFSTLVVALVLLRDNRREPFLTADDVQRVMRRLVAYCKLETDLRGYVTGKGWAHAAAHVSDAIDECVRNRHCTAEDCVQLWQGLRALVQHAEDVYGFEEDERIAVPLFAMAETGKVAVATLCDWLEQEHHPGDTSYEARIRRTNWKHVARSLYFRLHKHGLLGDEAERLVQMQDAFLLF